MGEDTSRICDTCRFWSEMMAQSIGGVVEAMCLSGTGPRAGKYTTVRMTCEAWKSGHHGSVDEPPDNGEHVRGLYEVEEGGKQ
jgi:hypothetical protein